MIFNILIALVRLVVTVWRVAFTLVRMAVVLFPLLYLYVQPDSPTLARSALMFGAACTVSFFVFCVLFAGWLSEGDGAAYVYAYDDAEWEAAEAKRREEEEEKRREDDDQDRINRERWDDHFESMRQLAQSMED